MKVLLVTIATLLHLFGLGDCFHLKNLFGTCSRQTHIIVFEGKGDGDKGGSSGRKRRKKRSADYPSFSYDGSTSYATRRTPQKVSFTMQCTDGTTYTNTTATVSGLSEFVQMTSQSQNPFETDLLKNRVQAEKSRLLENRAYAKKEPFLNSNLYSPPILKDLSPPPTKPSDTYWISTAARLSSFIGPYLIFPYLVLFLDHFVTMPPEKLAEITSKFAPGVSILYGTFVSLTLSILYNRQQKIQETVSTESSLISMITRNLLALFREDTDSAIEAGQCCADQIRILATGTRGGELMLLMYSDPYARMLELVESREERLTREQGDLGGGKG